MGDRASRRVGDPRSTQSARFDLPCFLPMSERRTLNSIARAWAVSLFPIMECWTGGLSEMLAYAGGIGVAGFFVRVRRVIRVDTQKSIAGPAWVYMDMQVRHFLEGGRPDGVP